MTRPADWLVIVACFLGMGYVAKLDADAEARYSAEQRSLATAADTACQPRDGYRVVASIASDGQQWARWCGYYRTVIETVRISWERQ